MNTELTALNFLPFAIFAIDQDYNIVFSNRITNQLLHTNKDHFIGQNLLEIFPHLKENKYKKRIDSVLNEGTTAVFSALLHKALIPFESKDIFLFQHTTISPIILNSGIEKAVFCIQDVTTEFIRISEYKKMRDLALREVEERKKAEAKLEKLNADKDKFFSIIAHDLKSPFLSLIGLSEFLYEDLDELSDEEKRTYSKNIHTSSKYVFSLLENLLEWSRIETGHMKYNPVFFKLDRLINERINLFKANAAQKNITIYYNCSEELEVFADINMIDTVFRNLLGNAIKFTNKNGAININIVKSDTTCLISVEDDGVGMSKQTLDKLFRIDTVVTSEGTEEEKGTGLGLILCKQMIEKNNGKIWAESEQGTGTKIRFTIPI